MKATHYISYKYQEPKLQRYKEFKRPHLALAFQGGGVKGVSYVGVYKQILKLQETVINKYQEQQKNN